MWVKTGLQARTARSPPCTSAPRSTAAPTAATAWPASTTRARCRRSPTRSRATSSRACASSPTSRRAGPSAATARRSRASRSSATSTSSAHDLGLDPAQWRLDNTAAPRTASPPTRCRCAPSACAKCLERVIERSGYREKRAARLGRAAASASPRARAYISGAGLPIYWNAMPHSGVQIKVDRGGGVAVFCGSTDIGQGSDSVLAYIVAEELGIAPKDIRVVTADTDLTPVDLGSYSSRVTLMTGNAAIQAARRVREPIFAAAARKLDVPAEAAARRPAAASATPTITARSLSFAEAVVLAEAADGTLGAVGSYTPPRSRREVEGRAASARRRPIPIPPARVELSVRPRDRHHPRRQGLDRARHRPLASTRCWCIGPGRGLGLHGPRRGADGGAGLPQGPAQDPVDARLQEPDDARDAAGGIDPRRDARSRGPVRRQGSAGRGRCCRHPGGGERASTTRSACASTRCRSRRRRCWRRSTAATGSRAMPAFEYPETVSVPPLEPPTRGRVAGGRRADAAAAAVSLRRARDRARGRAPSWLSDGADAMAGGRRHRPLSRT